jgi:hypothetical protein
MSIYQDKIELVDYTYLRYRQWFFLFGNVRAQSRIKQKYCLHRVTRPYLKSSAYSSFIITFSQQALVRYLTHPPSLEL